MAKKKFTASFIDSVKVDKQTDFYDEHTSGLGLRVSPGGAKTFFYRYRFNGKNRRYTIDRYSNTFRLTDARTRVDELRSYVKKGGDPHGEIRAKKNKAPKTLNECIEVYKEKHLPKLKESTRVDYERRIKLILKGLVKDRYMKDIQRYEILDFLEEYPPVQGQRIQAILSGVFKFSLNRGWVDANIATNINLTSKHTKRKKKWQNTAFDDQQIRTLWKAFSEHPEPNGSLFKILLILGQRSGETRKMKWKDVDFDKQLWTIPKTDTKNGTEHYVPLPKIALDILDRLKQLTSNDKYVFASPVKEHSPVGHGQKAAQRIREDYKIEEFNIHSLRTTFATRQAGLGTPPQVLSKLLNHKKPGEGSTITAIYNKYDYEDEKRIAINRWCNELHRIVSGKKAEVHKIA